MIKDKTNTLTKCIILLCREMELYKDTETKDYSLDLVKTIVDLFSKESKPLLGGETILIDSMLELLNSMANDIDSYDVTSIIDNLSIILKDHQSLLNSVVKSLTKELSESGLKKSIVSVRTQLNNYYREIEVKKRIARANFELSSGKYEGNFKEYIDGLLLQIDSLNTKVSEKTPGVVTEIDIEDDSMTEVLSSVKSLDNGMGKMKTGWKEMNTLLQGGWRRGEMVMIESLPHNYKSGLSQSLFLQASRHNVPLMIDKNKKPLNIYISFEDDAEVFGAFMYKYLYFEEHRKLPDMETVTPVEMHAYMRERLKVNGYHVKMLRINPSDWSFKDLFNYILKLEADGYEIHQCIIDYLSKLPPTGCIGKGGVEYRDLYDRCRQFFSPKKITLITPHQVSTEAKQLIRNGISRLNFVKEIVEKGYTELSKQLDQVVDIEIAIAIAYINKKPVLTIQRGKHRGAGILDDKDKYQILHFPYKAPIPPNIDDTDSPDNKEFNIDDEDMFI